MLIKLLTWNIGFAGGIYGLDGCVGTRKDVMARLSGIATVLSDVSADVVCLQEIDRHSKRSFYRDQVAYLATNAGYPYQAFVQTWRASWIPYPITWRIDRQFGPMDAGQVILSRHPISWHAHMTHPKPASRSGLFKYFYLDRVSQVVSLTLPKKEKLFLGHVHLEAFDVAARLSQAKALGTLIADWGDSFHPMLLCGDFNAIPQHPCQTYSFSDEPSLFYGKDGTIASFLDRGLCSAGMSSKAMDYPSYEPNRQLTHVFHSQTLTLESYDVLSTGSLSDHLPGVAIYRL